MDDPKFAFFIDGTFAATFVDAFPLADGRYRYEPYRGGGHYDLWRTIEAFGSARCFYEIGSDLVYFSARASSDYGFLNLSDFEKVPKQFDGYEL